MGFLAALLVFFIIPETHKKENRIPLRLNIIARNFMTLSKQKEVLGYMAVASFGFGGLFAFITAGSIVYIGIYGIPVDQFGYFFMLNIAIMTTASYLNGKFVLKLGAETMLRIGIAVQFISGIWLFLTALFDFGFWSMAIGVAFFCRSKPINLIQCYRLYSRKIPNYGRNRKFINGKCTFWCRRSDGLLGSEL